MRGLGRNLYGFFFKRKLDVTFKNVITKKFINTVYAMQTCKKSYFKDCSSYDISLDNSIVTSGSSRNVFEFYNNVDFYNANTSNYGNEAIIEGYTANNVYDEFARIDNCRQYTLKDSKISNLTLVTENHCLVGQPLIDKTVLIENCSFDNIKGIVSTDNSNVSDFTDYYYVDNCTGINLKRGLFIIIKNNTYLNINNSNFIVNKASNVRGYQDCILSLQGHSDVKINNTTIKDIATLDSSANGDPYDFIYVDSGTF